MEQPEISVEQHVDMEQPSLAVQAPLRSPPQLAVGHPSRLSLQMVIKHQDHTGEQVAMDNMETIQGTEESTIYENGMETQIYGDPVEVQGTDGTILEQTMMLTEEQNVAPSTAKNVDSMVLENKNTDGADKCVYNKRGMCGKHEKRGVGTQVSSKVWKDRGGGRGYGWVTRKVMKGFNDFPLH